MAGITGRLPLETSQSGLLVAVEMEPRPRVGQAACLVVYGPPVAKIVRDSQAYALVPYVVGKTNIPQVSQFHTAVVYATGVPDPRRSRAWWFTLDGHTFYVLDLGIEGTYVYDTTTKQWARWYTDGFDDMWNMKAGTMWGGLRVVAGDSITGQVWVIDPTNPMDEGWRTMRHVVTGGIMLRGRVYVGMSAMRLVGSAGAITSDMGEAEVRMRFSDDMGRTWSDYYVVTVTEGEFGEETAWRSLGSFSEPGRVIEIYDEGGMVRIDALDVTLDGFDEPPKPAMGGKSG